MGKEREEWRPIPRWPDHEASSHGRIRRSPDVAIKPGQVIRQWDRGNGYRAVHMVVAVHTLVAEAFLGVRAKQHSFVNHKDGDKENNRSSNLEYVTPSDNAVHAYRIGLQQRGERHGRSKLTDQQVAEIRSRYTGAWGQQTALANEYGVSQGLVSQIVRGEIWQHVSLGSSQMSRRNKARGERHPSASVTDEIVRAIRTRYAEGGVTHRELAEQYGISCTTVSRIVRGLIWKHVK